MVVYWFHDIGRDQKRRSLHTVAGWTMHTGAVKDTNPDHQATFRSIIHLRCDWPDALERTDQNIQL